MPHCVIYKHKIIVLKKIYLLGNKSINIETLNWVFSWYFNTKLWHDVLFHWIEIRYSPSDFCKKNDVAKWATRSMDSTGDNTEETVKLKCTLMQLIYWKLLARLCFNLRQGRRSCFRHKTDQNKIEYK